MKGLNHIAILAGGQSRRMGTNKARLLFEQHILLRRLVDDAEALGLKTLLCADDLAYPEVSQQTIASPDLLSNKSGALSAIQPALEKCHHAGEPWLWVYACDSLVRPSELLPFFQQAFIDATKESTPQTMIILPKLASGEQKTLPLIGLYRTELYASLKNYLLAGERRVIAFCKRHLTHEIILPEALTDCCNFNTPTEYERAKQEYINQLNSHEIFTFR